MGTGGIAPPFLPSALGGGEGVTSMPWGRSLWYPLNRGLVGPQCHSACCGVEKNLLSLLKIKLQPSNPQLITILTKLYCASKKGLIKNI
jgi:hypothetical protein